MSTEIKEVTEVVRTITGLKEDAKALRNKLHGDIERGKDAIRKIDEGIAAPLGDAVNELEGFLKDATNNPPKD